MTSEKRTYKKHTWPRCTPEQRREYQRLWRLEMMVPKREAKTYKSPRAAYDRARYERRVMLRDALNAWAAAVLGA